MGNFAEKAYTFTRENCPHFVPSRVLVAVSGGADSMCLLHVACMWRSKGFLPIAVHVMHGIRGAEAERDAAFVRENCEQLGVALRIVRADVPYVALREHMGLEEAGRLVRYEIFERLRQELEAEYVLTAHTASDVAETVFLNLLRGCGTAGLGGIPVCRGCIVRPLLFADRSDIERYCTQEQVPYIHDSTNDDCRYTRNAIRHRLLPVLKTICPSANAQLLRTARHARTDEEFLTNEANRLLIGAECGENSYLRARFVGVHDALRYRMLRLALEKLDCRSMEDRHYSVICRYIDQGNGTLQLPGCVTLSVTDEHLTLTQSTDAVDIPLPITVDTLPFEADFGGYSVYVRLYAAEEYNEMANVHNLFAKNAIDYDKIQGALQLRARVTGDRMHPAGRMVGKSVRRLMQECGLSVAQRDGYPLLCDESGVLLFPGNCCDERVRVTERTKHFLVCLVQRKQT